METEKLIYALEETITYLKNSESSGSSNLALEEINRKLEIAIARARNAKPIDVYTIESFFAPTGDLQKISIDNGWGTKFLRLAEVVDEFIGG